MEYREIRDDEGEYSETVEPCISSSHFMSSMLSEVVRLDSIDSFPFVCRYETQNIHERLLNESWNNTHAELGCDSLFAESLSHWENHRRCFSFLYYL